MKLHEKANHEIIENKIEILFEPQRTQRTQRELGGVNTKKTDFGKIIVWIIVLIYIHLYE